MSSLFAWPFLLTVVAGLGSLGLLRFLWTVRSRPGVRWFLVTLVVQALFCFTYAAALLVADPTLRYALEIAALVAFHWLGPVFLGFALEYTGRSRYVQSWYFRSLFLFPLATVVLLPLNPLHGLFWTGFEPEPVLGVVGAAYGNQPLLFVTVLGGALGVALGSVILFETFLGYGPLYRSEAIAVALSPVPPAIGVLAWLFELGPVTALNLTPVLFVPHVLFDAYAFAWSDMFEFHPATKRAAERSALDDLGSAVLVLDEHGRVVEANPRAERLFAGGDGLVTDPVEVVLGTDVSLSESQRLTLQHDGQQRDFRVRPAPLTDSGDNHVGYTLLFEDITEEVRREQRLQVLNRVLRHNLRNDMTVVLGQVGVARERSERDRVADALETVERKTETLLDTSEKARTVAQTIQRAADEPPTTVDVTETCRDVVAEYSSAFPDATVTVEGGQSVDADDAVTVETSAALLETVVENLVENALEHAGEAPTVTVTVERRSTDLVCVAVADDGPGIPDGELAAIRTGEETDLQHGSGLGLWLVKWGSELLGRDVQFETGPDGTTATLCVVDQSGDGVDG